MELIKSDEIENKIYTIRGLKVMLDSDLAKLYEVETGRLNESVNRNISRFPKDFMFQLTKEEYENLISQFAISSLEKHGGRRKLPLAFTEQGIAMLSGILRSQKAIEVNINIMRAFVEMRKVLSQNNLILEKFNHLEHKQIKFEIEANQRFTEIFDKFESTTLPKKQGIFYDGEVFDAYLFITDLIKQAKNKIILIDNYVDETTLNLFSKTKIKTIIYTKITDQLNQDLKHYNKQYNNIELKVFTKSHDRFLIIDNQIYHIGASLKDLGKKWFAFSKLDKIDLLDKLS